jgi:hypothetical protein
MLYRPYLPRKGRRCLWARPSEEAFTIGKDGEERHAQHGTREQGAHGGCCKWIYGANLGTQVLTATATTLHLGRGM